MRPLLLHLFVMSALVMTLTVQAQGPQGGNSGPDVPDSARASPGSERRASEAGMPAQAAGRLQLEPNVALSQELAAIDQELRRLRGLRPTRFLPVAIIVVGAGTTLVGGMVAVGALMAARHRRYGWDAQGNRYEYTYVDRAARAEARPLFAAPAIGAAVLGAGLALLLHINRVHRALAVQADPLQWRRQQLIRSLRYSVDVRFQTTTLFASVRF